MPSHASRSFPTNCAVCTRVLTNIQQAETGTAKSVACERQSEGSAQRAPRRLLERARCHDPARPSSSSTPCQAVCDLQLPRISATMNGCLPSPASAFSPYRRPRAPLPKPVPLPPLVNGSIDKGVRYLRFVPIQTASHLPTRVVPAYELHSAPDESPPQNTQPRAKILSDAERRARRLTYSAELKKRAPGNVKTVMVQPKNPPARAIRYHSDSSTQTDDENSEVLLVATAASIADRAISEAVANLRIEESASPSFHASFRLQDCVKRNRKRYKQHEAELTKALVATTRELSASQEQLRELQTSHELALQTCARLTANAVVNVQGVEDVFRRGGRRRDVASETAVRGPRQLQLIETGASAPLRDLFAELDKDFFPWLFARAETEYRRAVAAASTSFKGENAAAMQRTSCGRRRTTATHAQRLTNGGADLFGAAGTNRKPKLTLA